MRYFIFFIYVFILFSIFLISYFFYIITFDELLFLLHYNFFSSRFVSVHVVQPYSSIDVTAAWKKLRFILSVRSDFHIIDSLLIAVHAFVSLVSMSFSVDSALLPWYVNLSTSLRGVPSRVEMSPVWL